jgi:hypothetical protein
MGSGKMLWNSFRKHGRDNHRIEILEFCSSREDLKAKEAQLVNEQTINDPLCMNLCLGGGDKPKAPLRKEGWERVLKRVRGTRPVGIRKCDNCEELHDGGYGSGRFCCLSCSREWTAAHRSPETREKWSRLRKGKPIPHLHTEEVVQKRALRYRAGAAFRRKQRIIHNEFETLSQKDQKTRILMDQRNRCADCHGTTEWNGRSVRFRLRFRDGDHSNRSRANMFMICPMCASRSSA